MSHRPPLLRRLLTRLVLSTLAVPRDAVRFGLKRYGDRVAIISGGRALTFAQLADRTARLVGALQARGLGKDSLALMSLDDGPEHVEARLAALELGLVVTSFAPWADPERRHLLSSFGPPAVALLDARLSQPVKDALSSLAPGRVLQTGPEWEAELARSAPSRSRERLSRRDTAGLGFTSGTTGEPKAIATLQGALMDSLRLTATNVRAPVGDRMVMACAIPLNGAGSGVVMPLVLTGATLVLPESREPAALVELLKRHAATRAFVTPSQLLDLLDEPGFTRENLPALTNVIYGTAPTPAPRLQEAVQRLGPLFQQGYGMAEVLPPVSLLQMEQHVTGDGHPAPLEILRSAGWVVPEVSVRVVDAELRPVPPGEIGEVLVRSPTLFDGYWRPDGVDRSVFVDGYLRTGDYGTLRADGLLTVLDRRADLLQVGGRVLYPRLLEESAYGDPAVKEASLVQREPESPVVAFAAPRRGQAVDPEGLRERLRAAHVPVDEVRVLPQLPRSPLQKVLRRDLRELLASPGGSR